MAGMGIGIAAYPPDLQEEAVKTEASILRKSARPGFLGRLARHGTNKSQSACRSRANWVC